MKQIPVIFWTGTGNTQMMADVIAEAINAAGAEAVVKNVSEISADEAAGYAALALGCPAMGAEVLEECEFEPFFTELEGKLAGKRVALFGSYGWGDGQWMRDWVERAQGDGAQVLNGEGLICNEAPDDDVQAACRKLGADLAAW
mgnify:CR=1 FL=1